MPYGPETGVSAQRVAASLRNHVATMKTLELGPMVNQGVDNGNEFSFIVSSRDGSEMIVSVLLSKEPTRKDPPGKYTPATLAKRRAERQQQRYIEAQAQRRTRFLRVL